MKKRLICAATVCLVLLAALSGCVTKLPPADMPMPGGYTEDREPTEDELAIFNAALEGLVGNTYEAKLVATQVVAGVNYRFTGTATPVVPDGKPVDVYIYIFAPLSGEPELTEIADINK